MIQSTLADERSEGNQNMTRRKVLCKLYLVGVPDAGGGGGAGSNVGGGGNNDLVGGLNLSTIERF
jgi:hypothetical protein